MKRTSFLFPGAAILAAIATLAARPALAQFQAPFPSPKQTVTQTIGVTEVVVSYSRPLVKGRKIWGELVPFDKPWRTGANQATTVTFGDDVTVEGKKLAAGTYSLVTFPGKDEWTVVFNLDTALWFRTDYNPGLDVLRVKVKPVPAEFRESFEIGFQNVGPDSARLVLAWEKLAVPVSLQVEVKGHAIAKAREAVAKAKIDDWETPLAVARYYAAEKTNLPEALALAEKSITIKKGWSNLSWKARILAQDGKLPEAMKAGEDAVQFAKASPEKPSTESLEKLIAEWKAKK
jgi:Protein of unknown function (DUF2911)